jgi:hypothetical protein
VNEKITLLAEKLHSEGEKTMNFFRALHPEQWEMQLYADGSRWSVRQLLIHFITAEAGIEKLIENILEGGPGAAENFDIDGFNERQVAAIGNLAESELLNRFAEQRQRSIRLVENMHQEDLIRRGRHPFLGETSLEEILKLIYIHNHIHQRDVRAKLVSPLLSEK